MNCDEIIETISGHEQTIIFRFYSFLTAVNNIAQPLDSMRASKIKYASLRNDKKMYWKQTTLGMVEEKLENSTGVKQPGGLVG